MTEHGVKKHLSKKICAVLLLAAMCLSLAVGCAQSAPAPTPAPQESESAPAPTPEPQAFESAPAQAPEPEPDTGCDVLFYGDSITAGGNFGDYFPGLRVVNLGINGATIENLTEWVPDVSANHPARIFVMAGGNNLNAENVERCTELFRGLLDALREACPYAEIFVESMLPLDKAIAFSWNCPNRVVRDYNGRLEALAGEYGLAYLDIYPAYEYRGGLNSELTEDGIHLKDDAFGPWAEIVRPYIEH